VGGEGISRCERWASGTARMKGGRRIMRRGGTMSEVEKEKRRAQREVK